MAKKNVTVYLDEGIVDELKSKNYNISFLCSETLKTYVSEEFSDIELVAKLAAMDTAMNDLKVTLVQKQLEYDHAKRNYDVLAGRREQLKIDFEEAQNTLRMSRLVRELNKSIIALDFDEASISTVCLPILTKIYELSPQFNLVAHIKRFKAIICS